MAKLVGELGEIFELVPVRPRADGPYESYELKLATEGGIAFEQIYDVSGFSNRHGKVWHLADTFGEAPRLFTEKLSFGFGPYANPVKSPEKIQLHAGVGWLHATLEPKKERRKVLPDLDWILVRIYAQTDFEASPPPAFEQFLRHQFYCLPEVAQKFGMELRTECDEADRLRSGLDEN